MTDQTWLKSKTRLAGCVLLAEDSADARELMGFALKDAGAEVIAVKDGDEAVRAVSERSFDLILMDIRMPHKDGFTATAELRRQGCLTPIIALTASADRGDHDGMRKAGFDDFWQKPIPLRRLVEMAADYLREPRRDGTDGEPTVPEPGVTPTAESHVAALRGQFEGGLPARLQSLRETLKRGDQAAAHDVLHQLAGTAGIYGHMSVSREARRLMEIVEQTGGEKTLADRPEELHHLEGLIADIVGENPGAADT
jgi:CheY-like chemotaxis protein